MNPNITRATATLALAALATAAAAQGRLVPAQSEIVFTSRQMGVPVDGRFGRFDAQVAYDAKAPAAARVLIDIDLASVSIGTAEVEAELAKPEWFDTRKAARATFTGTSVKPIAPGRIDVTGRLALKGSTREITVPVALSSAGGTTTATGSVGLRRLDFRIGSGDWGDTSLVADEVQVRFRLVFTGLAAP